MCFEDRRKYPRIETESPVSQVLIDNGDPVEFQGMGRALNISRTGLMLETCHRIESEQVSLKSLDLDNKVIEITGRVIYSNQVAPDIHHIGISFLGSDDDMMDFSIRLLELSLSRRHNCYVKYAA